MYRVLKNNGYLFLSFPYMSPLRILKGKLGFYKPWEKGHSKDNFYQFILNSELVISDFQRIGFRLIKRFPFDGIKGVKSEIAVLKPLLQKIYNYKRENILINSFQKSFSFLFALIAGHCLLLIFQKSPQR